jgi:succinylglutamate desuccinylase
MRPGFENFEPVRKGAPMASLDRGNGALEVASPLSARVLMPRYQALGDDGFFLGREVRPFWLGISARLRRARLGWILPLLPGIRREGASTDRLVVNNAIARWLFVEVLHLFGYRWHSRDGRRVVFVRRRDVL